MRKKILIIRLSSLGDVVISTSVPRVLKDKFEIYFLTKDEFSQALEGIQYINILTINKKAQIWELIRTIRTINPDYIIDLQSKILTFIIRKSVDPLGKKTFVWDSQRFERRKAMLLKDFSQINHMILRFLEPAFLILDKEGLKMNIKSSEDIFPKIFAPPEPENKDLINLPKPFVVIAPEAKWKTKMWNLSECNKFVNYLAKSEFNIVIVGQNPKTADFFSEGIKLFGKLSLRDLKYIVSQSSCVVSLDSAISHIASALEIPTICIFTSSEPSMGFYPPKSKIVKRENIRCRPCSLHGRNNCPAGHWLCTFVEYKKVKDVFFEIINNQKNRNNQNQPQGT